MGAMCTPIVAVCVAETCFIVIGYPIFLQDPLTESLRGFFQSTFRSMRFDVRYER